MKTLRTIEDVRELAVEPLAFILHSSSYCADCDRVERYLRTLEKLHGEASFYLLKRGMLPALERDWPSKGVPTLHFYRYGERVRSDDVSSFSFRELAEHLDVSL